MPLSWNEIRDRAIAFARKWGNETNEHAEAKPFLEDFFEVFGVPRKKEALYEKAVQKLDGKSGYIDLFWPGKLVIEFKSRGKNLDRAFAQARDYSMGLSHKEAPKYILVCDFNRFKLYDLEENTEEVFLLSELPKKVQLFGFIAGYEKHKFADQDPVNIEAAELMGVLHDELKVIGYDGHDLEVLLVRLLFCLFADDTGIFMPRGVLKQFIHERTSEDGSDLAGRLTELFETLNTPEPKRFKNLDDQLKQFPYVNGKLFEERIRTAHFSSRMRKQLVDACDFDWSQISPAVFGALFQSIMDDKARRNLGAHYTSEKNIMKLIKPLFLDELRAELESIRRSPQKLKAFHEKLRSLTFFDPACGCGNFLVISYRELRMLELDVLRALQKTEQLALDARQVIKCDVDQFYGIEIEEFPAQIAQVALWLVDHQMNNLASAEFGQVVLRIPLTTSAKIVHGNALRINWEEVVPKEKLSYILGNPPFGGKQYKKNSRVEDQELVTKGMKSGADLDYVACWFIKAAAYVQDSNVPFAFVATNSLCQGEQVSLLWPHLLRERNLEIQFAHTTFRWSNDATGNAAVHCIIIGLSNPNLLLKKLYSYSTINSEPQESQVPHIGRILLPGPILLCQRSRSRLAGMYP